MIAFTIPRVVPCARPRATIARHPKTKRPLLNKDGQPFIRVYTDPRTEMFEREVRLIAGAAIRQPLNGYWAARVKVYTNTKRVMDLDNIVKAVIDGTVACGKVPDDARLWMYTEISRALTDGQERIEVELMEYEPRREGALV